MSRIEDFLRAALEASIYVAPRAHGLTRDELHEVAGRASFRPGEIDDALAALAQYGGVHNGRFCLEAGPTRNADFNFEQKPELRNPDAYDAVREELRALEREVGQAGAALDREVLVMRAAQKGPPTHDVEVAVTMMLLEALLVEKDGRVRHANGRSSGSWRVSR